MQSLSLNHWHVWPFICGNLGFWYGYAQPYWLLTVFYGFILVAHYSKLAVLNRWLLVGFLYPLSFLLCAANDLHTVTNFTEKQLLEGRVESWVRHKADSSRFIFKASKINGQQVRPTKILLRCYPVCDELTLGSRWQLLVKLKPAQGFANPAGFDFEKWLFNNNIKAQGYLSPSSYHELHESSSGLHKARSDIKARIQTSFYDPEVQGGLLAMLLGDRSGLSIDIQEVLRASGTAHLIAISGLHIGLAGLFGFGLGVGVWRLLSIQSQYLTMQPLAWLFASVIALGYAFLSGFGMPAQRAICMLSVFALSYVIGRQWSLEQRYSLAIIVVLLIQPKAPLDISFWLSFVVTGLLIVYQRLVHFNNYWASLFILQTVLFLSLSGLQILIFGQLSISSTLYNLWAIPWISFILLPLSMLWVALDTLLFVFDSGLGKSHLLTWLVHSSYRVFWWLLHLSDLPLSTLLHKTIPAVSAALIPLTLFSINLLTNIRLKLYFVFILGLSLIPKQLSQEFKMTVLDVGHGLAILVTYQTKAFLYDTGYGDEYMSRVDSIIVPYLRSQNIDKLDLVVISHNDNDHAGGLTSLMTTMGVERVVFTDMQSSSNLNCHAGSQWQFGDGMIKILSPESVGYFDSDNNNSCVVLITLNERQILLTGDIELHAEQSVIENYPNLQADIMLVPHHGSRTSSSRGFIEQIRPKIAINSSGFLNRFNLPAQSVVQRYKALDIDFYDTQSSGAIEIHIEEDGMIEISAYRQQNPALWRRNCYISQNYFVIQNERKLKGC